MADAPIDEVVGIKLEVADFKADELQAVDKFFNNIKAKMEGDGASLDKVVEKWAASLNVIKGDSRTNGTWGASAAFAHAQGMIADLQTQISEQFKASLNGMDVSALTNLYGAGKIDRATFREKAREALDRNPNLTASQKRLQMLNLSLAPDKKAREFRQAWDEAAKGLARFAATFYALEAPYRKFYQFIDGLKKANLQFSLMSQSALTTASALSSQSSLAAAAGSSASSFANFRRSFEMEMEKRRIGLGNGGQFTQALMHYGIRYNPYDFEATQRNIVAFMSDPTKSERQKQMAGQMLGMDQGMIAAAKRGNAFYESYTKETKGLVANQDEAAKKAEDLSLATQKLALAWQDFKNGVFNDFEPFIKWVVELSTSFVKLLKTPVGRFLTYAIVGTVGLVKSLSLLRFALGTGRMALSSFINLLTKLGRAGGVAGGIAGNVVGSAAGKAAGSAVGNVAGSAVGSAAGGGIAGGIGRKVGGVGASAGRFGSALLGGGLVGAVTGLANVIMLVVVIDVLKNIEKYIRIWHIEWEMVIRALMGKVSRTGVRKVAREEEIDDAFATGVLRLQESFKAFWGNTYRAHDNPAMASGVTVERLVVTVQTQASEPEAVAAMVKEVLLEEFKVVETGRRENIV